MAFDLVTIRAELVQAPLHAPLATELAIAVVNDVFRMGGAKPVTSEQWSDWLTAPKPPWPLVGEQLGMLAWVLSGSTALRTESAAALAPVAAKYDAKTALEKFFAAVAPLTAEMIRANAFRQEEFLRNWIWAMGGVIAKETGEQSEKRRDELDYRKTLAEYERAEKARAEEAEQRAKELAEAAAREAEARGWRE